MYICILVCSWATYNSVIFIGYGFMEFNLRYPTRPTDAQWHLYLANADANVFLKSVLCHLHITGVVYVILCYHLILTS